MRLNGNAPRFRLVRARGCTQPPPGRRSILAVASPAWPGHVPDIAITKSPCSDPTLSFPPEGNTVERVHTISRF
ncbi:unnamed protein product, partial [Iphiclides podalirius]